MDLKIFFSPLEEDITAGISSSSSFCKNIQINDGKMPDYLEADVALIGIEDLRRAVNLDGVLQRLQAKRRVLSRRHPPRQHVPGMPVHDRHQIRKSVRQW